MTGAPQREGQHRLVLDTVPGSYAICRAEPDAAPPAWAMAGSFWALARTSDELSAVCEEQRVPATVRAERGWRAFRVRGPLPFEAVGILAALSRVLADAGIPIFAISTFDTDTILVRAANTARAVAAWRAAGHRVQEETT